MARIVKNFREIMKRFHLNSIPLIDTSRKFFTNLETLHLYNEKDQIFNDGRIYKRYIWYEVDYERYLDQKEKGKQSRRVIYTRWNREKYGEIIPNGVNIIGYFCFGYCEYETISIPTSITELRNNAFSYCRNLKEISIPDSVNEIGHNCFGGCISLNSISISTSVISLGNFCFYGCLKLNGKIKVPERCFAKPSWL